MHFTTGPRWLDDLVVTSTVMRAGEATAFYRSARSGDFIRLANGVFLPTSTWSSLDADERFRARIHAVAASFPTGRVFSHLSAAALWRLPMVGSWPQKPEVVVGEGAVGATRQAFHARKYRIPQPDEIDRVLVTPLARTLVDVGRTSALSVSVPMMDRALSPLVEGNGMLAQLEHIGPLRAELASVTSARGVRRCEIALSLANGLSGSPGESLSRVGIFSLGLPAPILQHEFRDARGLVARADFWWPEANLVGEFDGQGKYLRDEMLRGRSTAEVVLAEKAREDRLRALGLRVTRWDWAVARSLPRLGSQLRQAGLG